MALLAHDRGQAVGQLGARAFQAARCFGALGVDEGGEEGANVVAEVAFGTATRGFFVQALLEDAGFEIDIEGLEGTLEADVVVRFARSLRTETGLYSCPLQWAACVVVRVKASAGAALPACQ